MKQPIRIMIMIFLLLCIIPTVMAVSIAPSRKVVDYTPGEYEGNVRIINTYKESLRLGISAMGELAEHVTIEETVVNLKSDEAEKTIYYTVNIPEGLESGTHEIKIVVTQLPEGYSEGDELLEDLSESQITALNAVAQQFRINVPYDESHVEGRLFISEGQVGDTITFTIPIINKGSITAEVEAEIVIKGPTNEELFKFKTNKATVSASDEGQLVAEWKADVPQGNFLAEAIVRYGEKSFILRKNFNVGNLFIEIEGLSVDNFKLGSIAKFDVDIESKWNEEIADVSGELAIFDKQGKDVATIRTLSEDVPAHGESTLEGYWDTKEVEVGSYDINVILSYAGKTTEKFYNVVVGLDRITFGQVSAGKVVVTGDSKDSIISILIIVVILLIAVNIVWFVFFKKRFKKPPG